MSIFSNPMFIMEYQNLILWYVVNDRKLIGIMIYNFSYCYTGKFKALIKMNS